MSQHPLLKEIESAFRRTDIPAFRSGDSVRVHTLIKEGDKERVQIFEGVVIGQHRGGSRASFTVRKVSYGVGVERIEIVQKGHVRRARLNYLRELQGRAAFRPTDSGTVAALDAGVHSIGKKIVEEAAEVWMAAEHEGKARTAEEISQLLYHLQVMMLAAEISLDDVYAHL